MCRRWRMRLILVHGMHVLRPGLDAVMALAQGLPVAPVPEELLISPVRNDMINVCGFHKFPILQALHTQRMHTQILFSRLLPLAAVTAFCRRPHFLGVQQSMLLTVFSIRRHQCRAAGMRTRFLWFCRRCTHISFYGKPKAGQALIAFALCRLVVDFPASLGEGINPSTNKIFRRTNYRVFPTKILLIFCERTLSQFSQGRPVFPKWP